MLPTQLGYGRIANPNAETIRIELRIAFSLGVLDLSWYAQQDSFDIGAKRWELNPAIDISSRIWPAEAEMVTEEDWQKLLKLASEDRSTTSKAILEPLGDSKDGVVAAFLILYWTLKITLIALQVSKEISRAPKDGRSEAILKSVLDRLSPDTPEIIRKRTEEIVKQLPEPTEHDEDASTT
jgi:hypothetical protein